MKYKEGFLSMLWNIGALMLAFLFNNVLVTTTFQFFKIPMSSFNVIVATIITILIYLLLRKKELKHKHIQHICCICSAFVIIILVTILGGRIIDTTCDGNFYHKTAIGAIKEGWNPVYESSYNFNLENNPDVANQESSLWMDHYPKATWNYGASIYAITGNIESGKSYIYILMISLGLMTFSYLSNEFLKIWQSFFIALIIVFNPITCAQIMTNYVDGIMGLFVYATILFLILIADEKYDRIGKFEKWLGLTASVVLCMNIKFTGIYFEALFCIPFYLIWLFNNRKNKNFKSYAFKLTMNFFVIVVISIGIVGESTFVKNTIEHNMPLYPLMGKDKVDIITTMQPQSFGEKNRIVKLFESIFSYSENISYYSGKNPKLKVPFTFINEEIENLSIPDIRIGGFGIFYSGILLLSMIALGVGLLILFRNEKSKYIYISTIVFSVIIETVFLDEAWWARYSPQLYIIPVIALFLLFYNAKYFNEKKFRGLSNIFGVGICIIIIANVLPFFKWRVIDFKVSKSIIQEMNDLKKSNKEEVNLYFIDDTRIAVLYNLNDNKINYKLIVNNNNDNHTRTHFYNNWMEY